MVVKCPNCGQQVRGEPGMSGPCPKCGTRFTFPEIVSTQIEDVLPLKVEKKKAPKVLFIVPATILFLLLVLIASIKVGNDIGGISIGMSQEQVLSKSKNDPKTVENEVSFQTQYPFYLFGANALITTSISPETGKAQKITALYWGGKEYYYDILKAWATIKYGLPESSDSSFIGNSRDCVWESGEKQVTLSVSSFDENTTTVKLTCLDTTSFLGKHIQDDTYVECGVRAFSAPLLGVEQDGRVLKYIHADADDNFYDLMSANLSIRGFSFNPDAPLLWLNAEKIENISDLGFYVSSDYVVAIPHKTSPDREDGKVTIYVYPIYS